MFIKGYIGTGQFYKRAHSSFREEVGMSSIRQKELVDVKELINEFSVEELCRNAENYFARIKDSENLLAKPFANSNDAQHLLVEISHLIRGLKLYPYMTILDFGSGTCWASIILNQMDYSVISLDVSLTSLKIGEELKKRYPTFGKKPPHKFMHFNGRKIDLPDESIDRIFGLDAFHHVPNQLEVLSEMARVLKKGGIAGFSEPGPNHSKQPQSQFEVRHFKVVENDILLDDILEKAKKVGFTGMRVCISSTYPLIVPLNEFNNFLHDKKQIKAYLAMTDNRMRNFPTFFLYKGESEIKDSREMEGLIAKIKANNTHFIVKTHETLNIDLQIKNNLMKVVIAEK